MSASGPSGGSGGGEFEIKPDNLNSKLRVSKIIVRENGDAIISIQAFYRNVSTGEEYESKRIGGPGGNEHIVRLAYDDYLTEIRGKCDNFIRSIQFVTNKSFSGIYGNDKPHYHDYNYYAMEDTEIAGFFGRSGSCLDAIGVYYRPINPNKVFLRSFSKSGNSGGAGGSYFDLREPIDNRISSVIIWADRYINGIQFKFTDQYLGYTSAWPTTGSETGVKHTFTLEADEYIEAIYGKYGNLVDSLKIKTNKRTFEKCGGDGGGNEFIYEAPKSAKISGFTGFAGLHIDSIGVTFEPITKLQYCGDDSYRVCSDGCMPYWFIQGSMGDGYCDGLLNCPELGYDLGDCKDTSSVGGCE